MDHPTQVALLRRIFEHLDAGTTEMAAEVYVNDVRTYTESAQLALERRRLFLAEPLLVGLNGDAADPGSYFTHLEGGVPILVVRGRDGTLRAFVDTCRHRGAQLASGAGSGSGRFTCPYHGWTYDDRGALIAQPCRAGFDSIPIESLSLRALPIGERCGMIFVRPEGEGSIDLIDLDTHLGGAEREIGPLGLEGYQPFGSHRSTQAMNWKLVIDTFLEAYHVPALHSRSLGPSINGSGAVWDAFGRGGRMLAVRRSVESLRGRPESEWDLLTHTVVLYHLFPNTVLIYQVDHVEIVQAYPGKEPDSAAVIVSLYTPQPVRTESERRHFQANLDLLIEATHNEDFRVGAQIQRGFHAPGHPPVLYGRNEPGVAHFHRMVRAALSP